MIDNNNDAVQALPHVGARYVAADFVVDVLRVVDADPPRYVVRRTDTTLGRQDVVEVTVGEIPGRLLITYPLSPEERAMPLSKRPTLIARYPLRLMDDLTRPDSPSYLWGVLRVETFPGGNGPPPLRNHVPGRRHVSLIVDDGVHKGWGNRSSLCKWALGGWMYWLRETVAEHGEWSTDRLVQHLADEARHSNLHVGTESIPEAPGCGRLMWHLDIAAGTS